MSWTSIIGAIASIVAILGIPYAIIRSLWELNYRKSTDHLGSLCTDEQYMSYFVAKGPSKWKYFYRFFHLPKTLPPYVLTVTGLIKAGDDGIFTSSMLTRIAKNHDQVSWKPFYEAFFSEYVNHALSLGHTYALFGDEEKKSLSTFIEAAAKRRPNALFQNQERFNLETRVASGHVSLSFSPILVKSCRQLRILSLQQNATFRSFFRTQDWWHYCNYIWIHGRHPSIEVSKDEIAALCLLLGIEVQSPSFLLKGVGAYGICLTSNKVERVTAFSLIYGPRDRYLAQGSGYSTMFAKHLACGSLPFAERLDEDKRVVYTILVTGNILKSLKLGKAIDDAPPTEETTPISSQYLDRLPKSAAAHNYFRHCHPGGLPGEILGMDGKRLAFWWEAVAGIAFGGLVPMATREIKEIVKFTVDGAVRWPENWGEGFRPLESLVQIMDSDLQNTAGLQIFGSVHHPTQGIETIFTQDTEDGGARVLVETLNRYTTLLERLIAVAEIESAPTSSSKVDEVHRILQKKIRLSYLKAINMTSEQERQYPTLEISTLLLGNPTAERKDIAKHIEERRVSADDCATAALCIIAAWARLTRAVEWRREGKGQVVPMNECSTNGRSKKSERVELVYCPLPLKGLPDVSAWH